MAQKLISTKTTSRVIKALGGTLAAAKYFDLTDSCIRGYIRNGMPHRMWRLYNAESKLASVGLK